MSLDPGARGLAAQARAASSALAIRNIGHVGIRIFGGRIANTKALATGSGNGRTFEVVATTAVPFDAIRVVTAFGQTGAADAISPTLWCSAKAIPDVSDASIATDTGWTTVNFGGANSFGGAFNPTMAPAPASGRRVLTVSDVMPVSSLSRTDGGAYPAIVIRVFLYTNGAAGNYVIQGDGSQSFANWENHPSGRIWRMRGKAGQFVAASQSGMTYANSAVENGSPIVGIVYYARGKVVNVAGFGDSITEGQGTYIGEGFGFPTCQSLSQNGAGVAYEWSNLGWSGQNATSVRQNIIDAVATAGLKFDIGVMPGGSPNDIGSTIAASDIANIRYRYSHAFDLLRTAGMLPVLWTWMPSNTAIKTYGATDSLRRALNDDYRTWAGRGGVIVDFDRALTGATSGGQVQMLAGTTSDNIHPNDAGNALLAALLARGLRGASTVSAGILTA